MLRVRPPKWPGITSATLVSSVVLCAACDTDGDIGGNAAQSTWTTQEHVKFGDFPVLEIVFSRPVVRADPARNRVLVMDPGNSHVSAWNLRGELLFVVGREGEGPGEFTFPQSLLVEEDGFAVVSGFGSRFTYFDADGQLVKSELGPGTQLGYQGHRVELGWPRNGVYVGLPAIPSSLVTGKEGARPFDRYPLLGIRRSDAGGWLDPEPLLMLDQRNRSTAVASRGGWAYSGQFFSDADQVRFLPGGALVTRQKGPPGAVELIEIDGRGDTLWHRRLQFEPRKLTRRMIDEKLDVIVSSLGPYTTDITLGELRRRYDEALYKPEYVPTAQNVFPTASGEVWLRTREIFDTLRVHYAVRRGDSKEPPRRVLLPEAVEFRDATATHVWGVWLDPLDVPHVVGLRLVPPG